MKKEIKLKIWGRIYILPFWIKYVGIAFLIVAALIAGICLRKQNKPDIITITSAPSFTPSPSFVTGTSLPAVIYVYVVGEVKTPGVYELSEGSMVKDAVSLAGGFTDKANPEAINMVEILSANTMIKVPAEGESAEIVGSSDGGQDKAGSKVNINTAGVEDLCTLSGVGESTAKKIIAYRETNGPFAAVEDIMNVPGIKEAKFMAIKEDICVG